MKRKAAIRLAVQSLCAITALGSVILLRSAPRVHAPLTQEAYVWQRVWNEPVREAIIQHGSMFSNLIVLKAEVFWKEKQPHIIRVPLDYSVLTNADTPSGLALRIGPYPGPFSATNNTTAMLTDLAASLVAESKANRLAVRELQIDFDCAESKLAGYRVWVEAIRQKVAPIPVTITVLPSWLNQSSFKELISAADGYVLQVHSLERPRDINARFTLCDPSVAKRAVERVGQYDVPFRVALPTYGYVIAFDRGGHFVGLSAEGPSKTWPEGVQLREVRANPEEVAQLTQSWATNHPASMQGIIWYRLPNSADNFNWRWPTLSAIMALRFPRESFRAESRRVEPGLVEISLANDGELDISSRLAIEVRWQDARLVAGDGLGGFELVDGGPSTMQFQTRSQPCRLPAGEKQVIGWLRLSEEREVQVEIKKR